MQRTWDNFILESKVEYGHAARRNRGRYAGSKIHALYVEYIVGFEDPSKEVRPGGLAAEFIRTGKPVLFSVHPICRCCQGQNAGHPVAGLTAANVTCQKCKPKPND